MFTLLVTCAIIYFTIGFFWTVFELEQAKNIITAPEDRIKLIFQNPWLSKHGSNILCWPKNVSCLRQIRKDKSKA